MQDDIEKRRQQEREAAKAEKEKRRQLKEAEAKKKAILDYKRKKLEAEEMMANQDLYDDESIAEQPFIKENRGPMDTMGLNSKDSFAHSLGLNTYQGKDHGQQQSGPAVNREPDDEDRYLDEIINRNYTGGKAPRAVN